MARLAVRMDKEGRGHRVLLRATGAQDLGDKEDGRRGHRLRQVPAHQRQLHRAQGLQCHMSGRIGVEEVEARAVWGFPIRQRGADSRHTPVARQASQQQDLGHRAVHSFYVPTHALDAFVSEGSSGREVAKSAAGIGLAPAVIPAAIVGSTAYTTAPCAVTGFEETGGEHRPVFEFIAPTGGPSGPWTRGICPQSDAHRIFFSPSTLTASSLMYEAISSMNPS